MHKEYILLNGFRKAKKGFTAGFHVPLKKFNTEETYYRNWHPIVEKLLPFKSLFFLLVNASFRRRHVSFVWLLLATASSSQTKESSKACVYKQKKTLER